MKKLAALLLAASIAPGSGCAAAQKTVVLPLVVQPVDCPAPETPALVPVPANFNSTAGVAALLFNDDALRAYVAGLRAAIACFRAQTDAAGETK